MFHVYTNDIVYIAAENQDEAVKIYNEDFDEDGKPEGFYCFDDEIYLSIYCFSDKNGIPRLDGIKYPSAYKATAIDDPDLWYEPLDEDYKWVIEAKAKDWAATNIGVIAETSR